MRKKKAENMKLNKREMKKYIVFTLAIFSVLLVILFFYDQFRPSDINQWKKTEETKIEDGVFEIKKKIIREFIAAEDKRDILKLKSIFVKDSIAYHGRSNISQESLIKDYQAVWSRLAFSSNEIMSISYINENLYRFVTRFEWVTKSGEEGETVDTLNVAFENDQIKEVKLNNN